jgi:twitching motility protein PilJ
MANLTLPAWMTGRKSAPKNQPVDVLTWMEPVTRVARGNAGNDDNPHTVFAPTAMPGSGQSRAMADDPNPTLMPSASKLQSRQSTGAKAEKGSFFSRFRRSSAANPGASSSLPLIGHLPSEKQLQILGTGVATALALTALSVGLYANESSKINRDVQASTDLRVLAQSLGVSASQAQTGMKEGFKEISTSRTDFDTLLMALRDGGDTKLGYVEAVQTQGQREKVTTLVEQWKKIAPQVDAVTKSETALSTLGQVVRKINDSTPRLQAATDQLALLMASVGPREQAVSSQLSMLTQRIAKNVNSLQAEEIDPEASFGLGKDVASFRDTLKGLREGSEALRVAPLKDALAVAALGEVSKTFDEIDASVGGILKLTPNLVQGKQAARDISMASSALSKDAEALSRSFTGAGNTGTVALWIASVFGLLTLSLLALLAKVLFDDTKKRRVQAEEENRRNQEAILRLLNEMGNLADGDLTVHASVTEDVTGAIADSINFTVDELRGVVTGINSTTDQVNNATQEAQRISVRLFEESQRQSTEIQKASALVLSMAQSINDVSASAAQSARVAQGSLSAAEQGTQAVQNQIASMNEIRGQIQETAKRIKRLGESSQEIGHITELIGDITQQTNVLALNAAIQAASAGDAGRGFSVVAEEVQRLAERSGDATKQIEAIVKTIQADTHDAVAAMERSTQGVVEGTKLSDAAGQALSEISRVSRELADLISNISGQTQRQATSVSEVTRGMQDILRVSEDASRSTQLTTTQIDKLTSLARSLRESVAGFKV